MAAERLSFRDSLHSIIEDQKRLLLRANGATAQLDKAMVTGTRDLSVAPRDFGQEAEMIERLLERVARVCRKRRVYLETTEGARLEAPDMAREIGRETRHMVLAEVGRSPLEVAYLFNYSNESVVRKLRERHGRSGQTGERIRSDNLTPAAHEIEEAR